MMHLKMILQIFFKGLHLKMKGFRPLKMNIALGPEIQEIEDWRAQLLRILFFGMQMKYMKALFWKKCIEQRSILMQTLY